MTGSTSGSHIPMRYVCLVSVALFLLLFMVVWSWTDDPRLLFKSLGRDRVTSTFATLPHHGELCTTETFNQGSWVHRPLPQSVSTPDAISTAAGYHCQGNFPHKCFLRDEAYEFERSKTMLDYAWQPDSCLLVSVDERAMARHLADHPLLFVGDSISQLQFESMACLLGQDLVVPQADAGLTGGRPDMWLSQLVHPVKANDPLAVSLAYLRTDYLVRLDDFKIMEPLDDEGYQIGKGSNFPWVQALSRFDYIMINTGHHWHPDAKWGPKKSRKEMLAAYTKAMQVVFDYLKANTKPHQRIWIRSTPYGHAKCSRYTHPNSKPKAPVGKPGEYEWDMMEKFDGVWKNWIQTENDERFHFFNVSLSNLRGDAHSRPNSDCLHTCLPGPVDDWNKLLFHEMAKTVYGNSTAR